MIYEPVTFPRNDGIGLHQCSIEAEDEPYQSIMRFYYICHSDHVGTIMAELNAAWLGDHSLAESFQRLSALGHHPYKWLSGSRAIQFVRECGVQMQDDIPDATLLDMQHHGP